MSASTKTTLAAEGHPPQRQFLLERRMMSYIQSRVQKGGTEVRATITLNKKECIMMTYPLLMVCNFKCS